MKKIDHELIRKQFRVAIFGSARIKKNDPFYKQVYELAKEIGQHGFDIVTGGGPGLMTAASDGHFAGTENSTELKRKTKSIGLTIQLPWEAKTNKHLDLKKHFNRFSNRLDNFMSLSNVVVVMEGGVGTALEFFYTLQLTQVKHICPIPIILVGKMWKKLMHWIYEYPVKEGLVGEEELKNVFLAKDNKTALKIILNTNKIYKKKGNDYCINYKIYKLD